MAQTSRSPRCLRLPEQRQHDQPADQLRRQIPPPARRLAHELKNPLFPLQITVENMVRAQAEHPEQFEEVFREGTETLLAELANLRTIIGRFSDFAKMPAPQLQPVDIDEVIRGAARPCEAQTQAPGKPPVALEELARYSWPGNVRELRNVVERLLLLASDDGVTGSTVEPLLAPGARTASPGAPLGTLAERVAGYERETILRELERNDHHITRTARALGLERSYLYKKCQQLGIDLRARRGDD